VCLSFGVTFGLHHVFADEIVEPETQVTTEQRLARRDGEDCGLVGKMKNVKSIFSNASFVRLRIWTILSWLNLLVVVQF
jgi:hypothetical protein